MSPLEKRKVTVINHDLQAFTVKEMAGDTGMQISEVKNLMVFYTSLGVFEICGEYDGETLYQFTAFGKEYAKTAGVV